MDPLVTEKTYPIRNIWLIKRIPLATGLVYLLISLLLIFGSEPLSSNSTPFALIVFTVFIISVFLIPISVTVFQRFNFHFAIHENFMAIHQGIVYKENKNIPYGRIQGIFVNQGLFDKIFGLASLTIEDFSNFGNSGMDAGGYVYLGKLRYETIGFVGNKLHIPGLTLADAEALKIIILKKIKDNPMEDGQSGL